MNWTGGRLHRSSYKTKSSSKGLEKQRFTQAKLRIINRTRSISPLKITTGATDKREGRGDGCPGSTAAVVGHRTNTQNGNQTHNYVQATKISPADSPTTMVDEMREKLLGKKDWAGLSLSRPYRPHATYEKDGRRSGKKRCLSGETELREYTLQQATPNKRQKMTQPRRRPSTQLSSDDISVWIEQQHGETQLEPSPTQIPKMAQEPAKSILFNTNAARGRARRSISAASIQQNTQVEGSQNTVRSSYVEEQGDYYLDMESEASLSPDLSNLPVLDRRGSFVTTDGQTRYIPPSTPKARTLGLLDGETGSEVSINIEKTCSQRKRDPSLCQRDKARRIIPRNPRGMEVADMTIEYSSQYLRGCNSKKVQQRDAIYVERHHNIDRLQTYSLYQTPFSQKFIQPPFYSKPRCSSYTPITSPHFNIQEAHANEKRYQKYQDSSSPTRYASRYANAEQRIGFHRALPKSPPNYSNLSPFQAPLRTYKVLVYGQEVDLSEGNHLGIPIIRSGTPKYGW